MQYTGSKYPIKSRCKLRRATFALPRDEYNER